MEKKTEKKEKILIIDDAEDIRKMLCLGLRGYGHEVAAAPDGKTARKLLKEEWFAVVVSDLKLPDVKGLELITYIKEASPLSRLVVITAHATLQAAKECVLKGATSFIVKPFTMEQMHYTVETALEELRLLQEEESNYQDLISEHFFADMVGKSLEMKKIYHTILTVAKTDSPVIISGETGTGKELVARAIHQQSDRSQKKMVAVNCASLSESLLESELFGHVRGAFTGAIKDKTGLLEVAANSTLFLDEISEISPQTQAKLLRFLQNGEFRAVGGTATKKSNARILASTNRELEKEIATGKFREDLYHRLNVISIHLPPLRERREDIPLLSHYFLKIFSGRQKKSVRTIAPAALSLLMAQHWPGNIRELQNSIERAVTFCAGEAILPHHLYPSMKMPLRAGGEINGLHLGKTAQSTEKAQITRALQMSGGNKSKAADLLGIDRITLWRKMKSLGMSDEV